MLARLVALLLLLSATPAFAQNQALLDRALGDALATLNQALPKLGNAEMGVDVTAYSAALAGQSFRSSYWGGAIAVELELRDGATGSCGQFAAFVRMPPENGAVRLVLCPVFFTDGADGLRTLTVLHEMVHVVAGPDECQAMAFAARVEQAANG